MADQKSTVMKSQTWLRTLGFYNPPLAIDGGWGAGSVKALNDLINSTLDPSKPLGVNKLAWGVKFGPAETARLKQMITNLRWPAAALQWIMGNIAFETGRSFDPAQTNGIGATGLIQFIPPTAIVYFNTAAQIAAMSADEKKAAGIAACKRLGAMTVLQQLDYVEKYFTPYAGKVNNIGDAYLAILWPAGVGKPDDYVLWSKDKQPTSYAQNAGLDMNLDGTVTRAECTHRVTNLLIEGFIGDNVKQY
jgi:hypothetical protein